jgi:hypothetical protein
MSHPYNNRGSDRRDRKPLSRDDNRVPDKRGREREKQVLDLFVLNRLASMVRKEGTETENQTGENHFLVAIMKEEGYYLGCAPNDLIETLEISGVQIQDL